MQIMIKLWKLLPVIFSILLGITFTITTLAQDAINYGQTFIVNIDGTSPQPSYTFNATAGDQITIEAFTLTPGLEAQLVLSDANAELITGNDLITHRILNDGTYTITLLPSPGLIGQIALKLDRREPQDAQLLEQGQGVSIPLTTDAHQLFFFYPNGDNEMTLCIHTPIPDFDFTGHLYNENGMQIAHIHHDLRQIQFTIPVLEPVSPQHFYEIELFATASNTSGEVIIGLNTCEVNTQLPAQAAEAVSPAETPIQIVQPTPTTAPEEIETVNPSQEIEKVQPSPTAVLEDTGVLEPTPTVEAIIPTGISPIETPTEQAICLDTDGDSVCDEDDHCPDEPGTFDGCPDQNTNGDVPGFETCPSDPNTLGGCLDTDGDGFHDGVDRCPTTPGAFDGCPDTDGDGFHDGIDQCVEIFSEVLRGCPENDEDGDGFPNEVDLCEEQFGIFEGCPDSDGDGFHDGIDQCDLSFGDVAPGCPDTDRDGVHDGEDLCPDLPIGFAENGRGCPDLRDDDGDGSLNFEDDCPQHPGSVDGCPDSDGDGFRNEQDFCPLDPGPIEGCNDSDQDGVHDGVDECPFASSEGGVGCPDTDGDGLHDGRDQCVDIRGDAPTGCPDKDSDGIPDASDRCVDVAGDPSLSGCPGINTNP